MFRTMMTLTLAAALMSGCAGTSKATGSIDETQKSKLPSYDGPRARIRLAEFRMEGSSGTSTYKVDGPDGEQTVTWSVETQNELTGGLKEMLKHALMETDRFVVLSREEAYSGMKSEHAEGEDGWVQSEDQIEKGQVIGPDLIINGKITKWAPDASGKNVGLGGLTGGLLGGMSVGSKKSEVGMMLEIVDIRTQEVLATIPAKGTASKSNLGFGGLGWGSSAIVGGIFSQYENTPMEDAIAQAIIAAADGLALRVPQKYFKYPREG